MKVKKIRVVGNEVAVVDLNPRGRRCAAEKGRKIHSHTNLLGVQNTRIRCFVGLYL